jgi:hypothetical protein
MVCRGDVAIQQCMSLLRDAKVFLAGAFGVAGHPAEIGTSSEQILGSASSVSSAGVSEIGLPQRVAVFMLREGSRPAP